MSDEVKLLGVTINTVVRALSDPDVLLEDFPRRAELAQVKDDAYYPVSLYVELTDFLEDGFGWGAMLRHGREVGRTVVDVSLSKMPIRSVREAIEAVQAAHEHFCQPVEGAFEVTRAEAGMLWVRYSAPYNCVLQEGLLMEVAARYGAGRPLVAHERCRRHGAEACIFRIKYSPEAPSTPPAPG
ncbi:MAG: hypothetical protein H6704_13715 [Myxococcales bacterium]|nr:hypothetical protein [Myxococcales bacterium]